MKQAEGKNSTNPITSDDLDEIDEQAAVWFARLRADNVSNQDKIEFSDWQNQNPLHRKAFYEICLLWDDPNFIKSLDQAANPIKAKLRIKKVLSPGNIWLSLSIAACLALFLVLRVDLNILLNADFVTGIGELKTIHLNDGSTVSLNTDSAITVTINGDQRHVEVLKGEAFFDVYPESHRPFIVHSNFSDTKVLGTRFFVHGKDNNDEVKVLSGRVEVSDKQNQKSSVILHNEESVSISSAGHGNTEKLTSPLTISWLDGHLKFENASLQDVIAQIQRYRHGVVLFKDRNLRSLKINGRINLYNNDHLLSTLEKTLSIKITRFSPWLVIIG